MVGSKNNKTEKYLFYITVFFITVFSISFLFMPIASDQAQKNNKVWLIVTGLLFWINLFGAYGVLIYINRKRKKYYTQKQEPLSSKPGIISFFSNPIAIASDIVMIIGIIGLICCLLLLRNESLNTVFLSVSVFSFQMHCLFNGRNYLFIHS